MISIRKNASVSCNIDLKIRPEMKKMIQENLKNCLKETNFEDVGKKKSGKVSVTAKFSMFENDNVFLLKMFLLWNFPHSIVET